MATHERTQPRNARSKMAFSAQIFMIGATTDGYLRAFKTATGEELWKVRLPASAHATPMTYRLRRDSKQFVVVAAGGHKLLGTKAGDALVAFALPD